MTRLAVHPNGLATPPHVVPAYFHPSVFPDQWDRLAERARDVHLVVLNPANGPGTRLDHAHIAPLRRLRAAGVTVAGYVDTDYGRRPLDDAIADLECFVTWYQVTAVCFDRAAADGQHVPYYAELASRARSMGARYVTFNHGTFPDREYAEHADLLGVFEGPWRVYVEVAVPRWTRSLPPEKFYHVVYSVPVGNFGDAYLLAACRGARFAFVTDHGGPNPYERLPASWLGLGLASTRQDESLDHRLPPSRLPSRFRASSTASRRRRSR